MGNKEGRPMSWEEARDAGERSARVNRAERELREERGYRSTGLTREQHEEAIRQALRDEEREEREDENRRD